VTDATESATAHAYRWSKQRLLDGRFPAGVLLSENELARELGISRTPIREAFLLLEAEGLLRLYPRRGALVSPISPTESDDVLEARLLIEGHCAARVAGPDVALSQSLAQSIAAQEASVAGDEAQGHVFAVADRQFHRAIVAAHGNALLTAGYDALRDRQQRIAANAAARDHGRIVQFVVEHREIADALQEGDGDRATRLISAHLRRAHDLARRPRR
jgi:DNA-binding GntR family transcriptional regulator